jgi:double-stranded uracil-DNA glycosylase
MEQAVHPIPPVYDSRSEILILGSFPSVKSREGCFFYHHPQNRFWKVLAAVMEAPLPETIEEKKAFLLKHRIAVWDVIASCRIEGSSDSSIRDAVPNDLSVIVNAAPIRRIFCNGGTSSRYYKKYQEKQLGRPAAVLPSTSPANAAWTLDRLVAAWSVILENQES